MKKKLAIILLVLCMVVAMFAACAQEAEPQEAQEAQVSEDATAATADTDVQESEDTSVQEAATDDKIVIGVTNMTMKESVYTFMKDAAMAKGEELGVEVVWQSCENDPAVQLQQVEDFIAKEVDVIAIEPARSDAAAQIVMKAKDAGIPVINFNALIMNESTDLWLVTENVKDGELQVQDFVDNVWDGEPCNVMVISGTKGDQMCEDITQGCMNILEKYPDLNLAVHQYHENWDRQLALNTTQDALVKYDNKIAAIFANNDTMALGCMQAAEDAGVADKIWFYGSDHDRDSVIAIQEGANLKVVDLNSMLTGERIVEAGIAIVKGEDIEGSVTVTQKENADVAKGGQLTWFVPIALVSADDLSMAKVKYPDLF